jgi:transposase-like protein
MIEKSSASRFDLQFQQERLMTKKPKIIRAPDNPSDRELCDTAIKLLLAGDKGIAEIASELGLQESKVQGYRDLCDTAIELVLAGDKSIAKIASELGLKESKVKGLMQLWKKNGGIVPANGKDFTEEEVIAEVQFVSIGPSSERQKCKITVEKPYLKYVDNVWYCRVRLHGLGFEDVFGCGGDSLQALCLALSTMSSLLEHRRDQGTNLYWPQKYKGKLQPFDFENYWGIKKK